MLESRKYKRLSTAYGKALKAFDAAGEIINSVEINSMYLSIKLTSLGSGKGWQFEEIEK